MPSDSSKATAAASPVQVKWLTPKQYAALHHLTVQTLANWRHLDLQAGRDHALPNFPQYKRFGRSIRYRLEAD